MALLYALPDGRTEQVSDAMSHDLCDYDYEQPAQGDGEQILYIFNRVLPQPA